MLVSPNFEPQVREMLTNLLTEHQNDQDDKAGKPYIVTDWDNTAIIFDSQQSLFIYQLEGLFYRLTPKRFSEIIALDLTGEQRRELQELLTEISHLYDKIYQEYQGFAGDKRLEEVKQTEEYKKFRQAMACLYKYPLSHLTECCRILYLFENYSVEEVKQLTLESLELGKSSHPHVENYAYSVAGKEYRAKFYMGMKLIPEQAEFFKACRDKGIEVYVCSASHHAVVELHASQYEIPAKNVFALELETDEQGYLLAKMKTEKPFTVQEGKAETIKQLLVPVHQRNPLLIMGDSMGDVAMMMEFPAKCVVVHTKYLDKVTQTLNGHERDIEFYVQGRDEVKGCWTGGSDCNFIS